MSTKDLIERLNRTQTTTRRSADKDGEGEGRSRVSTRVGARVIRRRRKTDREVLVDPHQRKKRINSSLASSGLSLPQEFAAAAAAARDSTAHNNHDIVVRVSAPPTATPDLVVTRYPTAPRPVTAYVHARETHEAIGKTWTCI